MATVRALSRELRLSPATVSRALRQDPRLSTATIQRVAALAAARGFPVQRSASVGAGARLVLVLIRDRRGALTRHHQGAVDGLRRAARAAGVAIAVQHHLASDAHAPMIQAALADVRLAGIILIGGCDLDFAATLSRRAPLVSLGHDLPLPLVDAVQADHQRSAETLVEHLAGLGHRRIGLLCGAGHDAPTRDRVSGYRSALARLGCDDRQDLVVRHRSAVPGITDVRRLIRLARTGVRGWLIGGHDTLSGVVAALHTAKLRVPADLSVVGFHQTGVLADGYRPTCCPIPAVRLGEELLASLVDRWQGRSGGRRILITCPLLVGETSGPAPERLP